MTEFSRCLELLKRLENRESLTLQELKELRALLSSVTQVVSSHVALKVEQESEGN